MSKLGKKLIAALEETMQDLPAIIDRQDHLCRHPPRCPQCNTEQVQLVAFKMQPPALWRCHLCKHRFSHEP